MMKLTLKVEGLPGSGKGLVIEKIVRLLMAEGWCFSKIDTYNDPPAIVIGGLKETKWDTKKSES
jgi:Ni2+-binding GTPase involved in maturation of urease and hydrogenase